jgi:arsenate reductase
VTRVNILFVCLGNAHRSQMAEGFAKQLGVDVVEAESAGIAPASYVPEVTRQVMLEKGISLEEHYPKGMDEIRMEDVDIVVNMSGVTLHRLPVRRVIEWKVKDPVRQSDAVHRQVRDQIEALVAALLEELRQKRAGI